MPRPRAGSKDIATIFKLAQKWSDRYDDAKSKEEYKELLAFDPDGKMGTTEYQKEQVSYTEYAEFNLGSGAVRTRPPDPAPLLAEKAVETAPSEQLKNLFRKQIDQIKAAQEKK